MLDNTLVIQSSDGFHVHGFTDEKIPQIVLEKDGVPYQDPRYRVWQFLEQETCRNKLCDQSVGQILDHGIK